MSQTLRLRYNFKNFNATIFNYDFGVSQYFNY